MTTDEAIRFFLEALTQMEKTGAGSGYMKEMKAAFRKALEALLEKEQAEDR